MPSTTGLSEDRSASATTNYFNSSTFESRVTSLFPEWHVPGLSITLVCEKHLGSRGFGLASIDPKIACTPDTLFDIASSSKPLTAGAVGILVGNDDEFDHVRWDSKMCELLPDDFVLSEEAYTKEVTVEDILSHRTGMPGHDDAFFGLRSKNPDTVKSVTRKLRYLPINKPLRTEYQYSNTMMTVATHLTEHLTKKTFSDFLTQSILQPLDLTDTHLQPGAVTAAGKQARLAKPYQWQEGTQTYKAEKVQEVPEAQGAGSIQTSTNEYIKWVRALMYREGPITEELYDGLTRARIVQDPESTSRRRMGRRVHDLSRSAYQRRKPCPR